MSLKGTVKFFRNDKGYGFIKKADGTGDIFVHVSGVADGLMLVEGLPVVFDIETGHKKGDRAVNVESVQT